MQLILFSHEQALLLLPEAKNCLPADDVAHFMVTAVERVPISAFASGRSRWEGAVLPARVAGLADLRIRQRHLLLAADRAGDILRPGAHYDRAKELREKPAADITELTAKAKAADAEEQPDRQALSDGITRREALQAKLDAACARLVEQARAEAEVVRAEQPAKQAARDPGTGRRRCRPTTKAT